MGALGGPSELLDAICRLLPFSFPPLLGFSSGLRSNPAPMPTDRRSHENKTSPMIAGPNRKAVSHITFFVFLPGIIMFV